MKTKWIACFSQTGTEIFDIAKAINRYPDLLITNNKLKNINENLIHYYNENPDKDIIIVDVKLTNNIYRKLFSTFKKPLITLNGWLRIIPPDICSEFRIVNGHPGLITEYPELKGKDPVDRVWANKDRYKLFGSVIHNVTAEVDDGKIISSASKELDPTLSFEELCAQQRSISFNLWVDFLKSNLK